MKKSLLFSSLALLASQTVMGAETPQMLPGYFATVVSHNGQYLVSQDWTTVIIRDLSNGQEWVFSAEDDSQTYSIGNGNAMSDNGILVGSVSTANDASFFKDGEWHSIFSCSGYEMTTLNGITADGSRICGSVQNQDNESGYEGTMLVPMYLDAEGDDFGDVVMLPHPTTDFTGRAPQYITALQISDNGRVILGQVVDYSGMFPTPIVYTQNEAGEWSYTLPCADLLNPSGLELPEEPVAPDQPDPLTYMSDAAREAYEIAYQEWVNSGYQPSLYPDPVEYLDMDQLEAYNAAVEVYNAEAAVYNELLMAFYEVWEQIAAESTGFVFNNGNLSPDGTKFSTTIDKPGETFWDPSINYPVVVELQNGELKSYQVEGQSQIIANTITDGGALLASNLLSAGIVNTYILAEGATEMVSLYDYFLENVPSNAVWMDDNMRHDVAVYDPETWEPVLMTDVMISGIGYGSSDLSTIVTGAQVLWEGDEDYLVCSYVFNNASSGIVDATVDTAKEIKLAAQRGGLLYISGEVASVEIYDLGGQVVFNTVAPSAVINTRLSNGVYVARATGADGSVHSFKLLF